MRATSWLAWTHRQRYGEKQLDFKGPELKFQIFQFLALHFGQDIYPLCADH